MKQAFKHMYGIIREAAQAHLMSDLPFVFPLFLDGQHRSTKITKDGRLIVDMGSYTRGGFLHEDPAQAARQLVDMIAR